MNRWLKFVLHQLKSASFKSWLALIYLILVVVIASQSICYLNQVEEDPFAGLLSFILRTVGVVGISALLLLPSLVLVILDKLSLIYKLLIVINSALYGYFAFWPHSPTWYFAQAQQSTQIDFAKYGIMTQTDAESLIANHYPSPKQSCFVLQIPNSQGISQLQALLPQRGFAPQSAQGVDCHHLHLPPGLGQEWSLTKGDQNMTVILLPQSSTLIYNQSSR